MVIVVDVEVLVVDLAVETAEDVAVVETAGIAVVVGTAVTAAAVAVVVVVERMMAGRKSGPL